jgi:uncharacterized protein (TIGR04222 family)
MDWLIHNPIADIHGPAFLLVYGVIAMAVIAVARQIVLSQDKSGLREPPLVPATLDPYELAYLRGGKYAVIRTAVYALHQLGVIEVSPKKWFNPVRLAAKADARPARPLNELELKVLGALRSPVEPSSLFRSRAFASSVERLCQPFRNHLELEGLLRSSAVRTSALMIPFTAGAFLVALSLYKIGIAAGEQRPFIFLFFATVIALAILGKTVGDVAAAHATVRGRAYLRRLQDAYRDALRPAAAGAETSSQPDMLSVALVGLFGIGILSATPDAAFASLFSTASSGGGGSVEVGSSGCGGSGCGGGCGGGGCGGGCGG